MADRYERIRIFEETMKLCRNHPTLAKSVDYSTREQKIIWQEDPLYAPEIHFAEPARLTLSSKRTFEAAREHASRCKRVCALNFASSVTPGGGVTRGTTAQEESMCRISTLYAAISDRETAGPFYERHKQMIRDNTMGRENRDDCIYTPGVVVICEDTFDCAMLPEKEWYSVDVITCAAPDLRHDENGKTFKPTKEELTRVFEQRWKRILSVAAGHEAEVLILGAFGCGAFYNPPAIVVEAFNNVFSEFQHSFETVEFAVFTRDRDADNYRAFRNIQRIEEEGMSSIHTEGNTSVIDLRGKNEEEIIKAYAEISERTLLLHTLLHMYTNKDRAVEMYHKLLEETVDDTVLKTDHQRISKVDSADSELDKEREENNYSNAQNGILIEEASFTWHKLLSLIDMLNRRVKEPGWRYEDKQQVYQLKDRMLEKLLRIRPGCVKVTLYYIPYMRYSMATKDKAGEMMRQDRNRFSFEFYLTQVPPTDADVEVPEDAMVELEASCLEESFCFHMPVQLAAQCGIEPFGLPRKPWIAAPEFHHNQLAEAVPAIESLLNEVDG